MKVQPKLLAIIEKLNYPHITFKLFFNDPMVKPHLLAGRIKYQQILFVSFDIYEFTIYLCEVKPNSTDPRFPNAFSKRRIIDFVGRTQHGSNFIGTHSGMQLIHVVYSKRGVPHIRVGMGHRTTLLAYRESNNNYY
jgi:hypothetical protein